MISEGGQCKDARFEERFGNAGLEHRSLLYVHYHQLFVSAKVKELFSISPPLRLGTAARRYPPLTTGGRKSLDVNFRSSRLIRGIGKPFSIRRELSLLFVEDCLQEG